VPELVAKAYVGAAMPPVAGAIVYVEPEAKVSLRAKTPELVLVIVVTLPEAVAVAPGLAVCPELMQFVLPHRAEFPIIAASRFNAALASLFE
jgi:hypothetical protein